MKEALLAFVETIEATGGLVNTADGYAPMGDPEWPDLADAYLKACNALGRTPVIEDDQHDD